MPKIPASVGPFRIVRLLGRGGMGVVYDAVSPRSGQRVALKTVGSAERQSLVDLRREIHALRRLRHRGIVRIVDDGVEAGLPWYAMELCEGRTLRSVIAGWEGAAFASTDDWWTGVTGDVGLRTELLGAGDAAVPAAAPQVRRNAAPLLASALELAGRLCAPLAHMHAEGLVHRDLKPENVIVGGDGWPVIVDFGLVTSFTERTGGSGGRDSLGMTADLSGTVAYVAPEQSRGEVVDARADLYSFGCILYELVTGRPPFISRSIAELLAAHHARKPDPPSAHADGVPPALDELVLSLLEKDPNDRIGYADVVADRLAAMGGPAVEAPAGSYLYRPRRVGHDAPLATLVACLDEARRGWGSLQCIVGEAGSGRTRMALEVALVARRSRMTVEHGECARRAPPFGPVRSVLRSVADRCHDPVLAPRLLGPRLRVLEPFEPAFAALTGQDRFPLPETLAPAEAALRYYGVFTELLATLGSAGPWLLLLDDLHRADELTLGLLRHLLVTRRLEAMRLLVLGTCREDQWERVGAGLPGIAPVALPPLTASDVGQLAAGMLALDELPVPFVEAIAERSRGLPSLAAELVHDAVGSGILARDPVGVWKFEVAPADLAAALPASLLESLDRRLGAIGRPEVGEAAALLGRDVDARLLAAVLGLSLEEVWDALDDLTRVHLVEESRERIRFSLDEHRRALADRVEPARRRELHRRAAEELEARGLPSSHAASIARHWEQAQEPERAIARYRQAADHALEIHALDAAEAALRAILALAPEGSEASALAHRDLGAEVLARRARVPEAVQELTLAVDAAAALGDRELGTRLLLDRAHALRDHGKPAEARVDAERILAAGGATPKAQLQCHSMLSSIAVFDGRMDDAERHMAWALALMEQVADPRTRAMLLGGLATLRKRQGRIAEAEESYRRAMEIGRDGGPRLVAVLMCNAALLLDEQGRIGEAEALYRQSLERARQTGDRRLECGVLANLAGLVDSAELFAEALPIAREAGNRRFEAHILGCLGRIELGRARTQESIAFLEKSIAVSRECGDRRQEAIASALLARARFDAGEVEESRLGLERAAADHEAMGDVRLAAVARSALGLVHRAKGELDVAERFAREALVVLESIEAREECVSCHVELAFIALARGRDFDEPIAASARIVDGASWPPTNPARRAHERALATREAFLAGETLLQGCRPDDWPDPIRILLEEKGKA